MVYRNPKLLRLAKDAPCMICGSSDQTVTSAHSNQIRDGKGTGIKSHDYRIAFLCHYHHFQIDNGNDLTKQQKLELWEDGHRKTIAWLFDNGHLEVK